jgi:hypothetical protein
MAVAEKARKALDLKKLALPPSPKIVAIEVDDYVDWEGNDSLRIWAILDEDVDVEHLTGRAVISLKAAIHEALLKKSITEFPYISLAKASERAAIADEE